MAAIAFALQPLCASAVAWFLDPESGALLQGVLSPEAPVPSSVSWGGPILSIVLLLGGMSGAGALVYLVCVGCAAAYICVRALNPTFRVTTGVDWDRVILFKTYMHSAPLIKLFLIVVTATVPLAVVLSGMAALVPGRGAVLLGLVILTASAWCLLSPEGIAGDLDSGSYELPRDIRTVGSLIGRGVTFGVLVAAAGYCVEPWSPAHLSRVLASMGGVGQARWLLLALIHLAGVAVVGFACGAALVALGWRPERSRRRGSGLAFAVLVLGVVACLSHAMWAKVVLSKLNWAVGNVPDRMSRAAGVSTGTVRQTFYAVYEDRALPVRCLAQSIAGIQLKHDTTERLRTYLRRSGYRTSLSLPVLQTLFDARCVEWDPSGSLDVCRMNFATMGAPDLLPPMLDVLATCSDGASARGALADLARPDRWVYGTNNSFAMAGDLCARLGQREQARSWYLRAGVTSTMVDGRLNAQLRPARGVITGRVSLDGAPSAGVRVGIAPVGSAQAEGIDGRSRGAVRPYAFRVVSGSALTDRDGRFRLTGAVRGEYRILLSFGAKTVAPTLRVTGLVASDVGVTGTGPDTAIGDLALRSGE